MRHAVLMAILSAYIILVVSAVVVVAENKFVILVFMCSPAHTQFPDANTPSVPVSQINTQNTRTQSRNGFNSMLDSHGSHLYVPDT